MGKLVIFEIGEGSFVTGFPVKIRIGEEGKTHTLEISGHLPSAPQLPEIYRQWQSIYYNLPANWLIKVPKTQITNVSTIGSCQNAALKFIESFNEWLNLPAARQLERKLLLNVQSWQETRLILRTKNAMLLRFPWHLWDLFQSSYYQPEIIIGSDYEPSITKLKSPVKILAVFGDNTDINTSADLEALKQKLPDAHIQDLQQPTCKQLIDCLWNQSWDILFFAGHSSSQEGDSWGEIKLNSEEELSLLNLRRTLQHAVSKGLKLAIFNSCDGLGLARNLANLRIPYTIVMREPVPDIVAQHFLEYFLTAFARGESLYASVQQARTRLNEELDRDYPCASWLPIIFQNPAAAPLVYPRPRNWSRIGLLSGIGAFSLGLLVSLGTVFIQEIQFSQRLSAGEKILDQQVFSEHKQKGVRAFSVRQYQLAIDNFETSLAANPNDPETLIYLNNAKAQLHSNQQNQMPIAIGVGVPIGSNINVAREMLRGVAQAQQEINQRGGLQGRLLQVKIANDENNGKIAKEIAQRFVSDRNLLAVVGHNASDASFPAAGIYQDGNLVMITPTSTWEGLTQIPRNNENNYIYRTIVGFDSIINQLTEYAKSTGIGKISLCQDTRAKDRSSKKAFEDSIRRENLEIVEIKCDFGTRNFQPEQIIQTAIAKNVEAIFLDPHIDRLDLAFQLAQVNQGRLTLLGNSSFQTSSTLNAGKYTNGMVLAVDWFVDAFAKDTFVKNALGLWQNKDAISWRTANSYDAAQVIAAAIERSDRISRSQLQQVLANNFLFAEGVTGSIKFNSDGDRISNHPGILLQVRPDPNRANQYNFAIHNALQTRLSQGKQILIPGDKQKPNRAKKAGVEAYAGGDFPKAIAEFKAALAVDKNDPETLIYLQNSQAAVAKERVRIAVVVPIGSNLDVSLQMLRGIAQAQQEINLQGGINGKLLQVLIANDDNNPTISKQLARYLSNQQKDILAVIGSNASDASAAGCKIYQQNKLVNISPTSFSLELSECGSYTFRTAPNVQFIADELSNYAVKQARTKKLAVCVDEKARDNKSFRNAFTNAVKRYGGEIVRISCDFSATDFQPSQIIKTAIQQGIQGILLAPHIDRIDRALELAAAAQQRRLKLYGSTSLYTPKTIEVGKANVNGLVIPANWHPQAQLNPEFTQVAKKLWDNPVTWRTATSYDAAVTIITALKTSNTRSQLQQTLINPKFIASGATGTIQFSQSGDRDNQNNALLLQIQPSSTSPQGYDFALKSANRF